MNFLFDTNLLIAADPTAQAEVEPTTEVVARLIGELVKARCMDYIHPCSKEEIEKDRNSERRKTRISLIHKYPILPSPPQVDKAIRTELNLQTSGAHDEIDLALLSALRGNAVDFLVTEDRGLLRKASRLGLRQRTVTIEEAIHIAELLLPRTPSPPPAVQSVLAHELDKSDPIFDSLNKDYPDFDMWFTKVQRQHRQTWIIKGFDHHYDAVCIVKPEDPDDNPLRGNVLKICTLKVANRALGLGYGELILKTIFEYSRENRFSELYLTILPKYKALITQIEDFGFEESQRYQRREDENVYVKVLKPKIDGPNISPLEFNIRYGPWNINFRDCDAYVVPVQPRYHKELFPEIESNPGLFAGQIPSGNAIRKVYICRSPLREIPPGSMLLFYRSRDMKEVRCIGVVESTLRTADSTQMIRYVGSRTVYTIHMIESICKKSEVLAILFRQARVLSKPWSREQLVDQGVLKGAPRSITAVPKEGLKWLQTQLETSP